MRRVTALVLVLSLVVLARHIGGDGGGRFATMALGFVLIVAALVGEALEHLKLPRLTGYLLVGLCFGPSALNLVTPGMATQLRLVNGLAVALIAFGAGMELDIVRLRGRWQSLLRHGGLLLAFLYAGFFSAMLAATPFLAFTAGSSWKIRIAVSVLTASALATFSPTVVMAVLAETRARGPLAERVLQLVILADLGVVLLFTGATTVAHLLDGASVDAGTVFRHVSWEVIGSLVIGLAVGAGFYAYRRFVNQRTGLVLAGACLMIAEVGSRVGLSPLLCCLAAGFVARNAAREATDDMEELLERVRLPVLVVFFAAAGASLHLQQLLAVAPMAVALVLLRLLLIVGANRVAARHAGVPEPVASHVPFGLVSQAGIALGLAVIIGRDFGAWGAVLETLFVAVISLHELAGPIVFRWALQRLGEVPAPVEHTPVVPVVT
jgi:Kef-type K+ transport system membrane component KefB